MNNSDDVSAFRAPYCSPDAFANLFDRLRKRGATRVDLKLLETWGVPQAKKLIPALKFLGIIDDKAEPDRARWASLAQNDPDRFRAAAEEMVHSAYTAAFAVYPNLEELNDSMIGDVFAEIYNTAPGSKGSAVRFFRHMQSYYRDATPLSAITEPAKGTGPTLRTPGVHGASPRRRAPEAQHLSRADALRVVVNVIDTDDENELAAKFAMIQRAWRRSSE